MTRFLIVAGCLVLPSSGCMVKNRYSSDPNQRMLPLTNQTKDLREIENEVDKFWMADQPSPSPPGRDLRRQNEGIRPPRAGNDARIGAFEPTRFIRGVTPAEPLKLTVANVHKEPVTVFAVEDGQLTFLQQIPPGEAVDLIPPPGGRLAATFRAAPHCANYAVKGVKDEVWLLR